MPRSGMRAPWPAKITGASAMRLAGVAARQQDIVRRRTATGRPLRGPARLRSPGGALDQPHRLEPGAVLARRLEAARARTARRYSRWSGARPRCRARGPGIRRWRARSIWRSMSAGVTGAVGPGCGGERDEARRSEAARRRGARRWNMALLKERRRELASDSGAASRRAPWRAAPGACVDVHRLDHPALVALGAAGRGRDQPPRGLDLGLARARTARLAVSIWLGWITDLPSKPKARPFRAFRGQARRPPRAGCRRRRRRRRRRRARRARSAAARRRGPPAPPSAGRPSAGGKIVGAGDQPGAMPARSPPRRSPPRGVSIIASTGLPISQPASCTCLALSALARTMKSAAQWRTATTSSPKCGLSDGLTRTATGRPPKPSAVAATAASRAAALSSVLHRILEVEDDHVGGERPRLLDRARIGGGQEQQRAAEAKIGPVHRASDSAWIGGALST